MDEFDYNCHRRHLPGEQTASQRNAGTFANSAAIVRAMEPVPRMPIFIGTPFLMYNGYQTLL